MKKNVLAALTAMLLSAPVFAADSKTDSHNVTIQVPEVALINVDDADVTFVCALETFGDQIAGENFECNGNDGSNSAAVTSSYNITANIGANANTSRKLTVKADQTIDTSWKLVTNVTQPSASGSTVADVRIENATDKDVVTGIKNVAESNLDISYTLGPATNNVAMAFSGDGTTKDTIEVTYTLEDDL